MGDVSDWGQVPGKRVFFQGAGTVSDADGTGVADDKARMRHPIPNSQKLESDLPVDGFLFNPDGNILSGILP